MTKAELDKANVALANEAEHLRAALVSIIQLPPGVSEEARRLARRALRTNKPLSGKSE